MPMMICGVEEPLQTNEQLLTLDEETDRIVLNRFGIDRLNRYTLVWSGELVAATSPFAHLLHAIQQQLKTSASWLSVWMDHLADMDFSIRAKWIASMRRKEGWSIHPLRGLYVATKPIAGGDFNITDFYVQHGGKLLVFGDTVQPEQFAEPPARASMERLAIWHNLAPSQSFLFWIADQHVTIAYQVPVEGGDLFFVVISPHRLQIRELMAQGLIDKVMNGPEAGQIWRWR
jgi:hypothetical protein